MKTIPELKFVTLTGVDDHTDLQDLLVLSLRYPVVEWGFLYSPKRQGKGGRYPSVETILKFFRGLPWQINVALHVCGLGVQDLLDGVLNSGMLGETGGAKIGGIDGELNEKNTATELLEILAKRGGARVQLNFNQSKKNFDLTLFGKLFDRYPMLTFIVQHNNANKEVWKALQGYPNFAALFDSSGGRGIECNSWPVSLTKTYCGYAGGLGPDNIKSQLPLIRSAVQASAGVASYWIDMEGKLRGNNDVFNLKRCKETLIAVTASTYLERLNQEEIAAAVRFCETCEDGEEFDVSLSMMKKLHQAGLVLDKGRKRFEPTGVLHDIRGDLEDHLILMEQAQNET